MQYRRLTLSTRFSAILLTALVLAFALAACTFEVQPIEEYTSADGYLSFTYPASWDLVGDEMANGSLTAVVGTRPDVFEISAAPPGQAGAGVILSANVVPAPGGQVMTLTPAEMARYMRERAALEMPVVSDVAAVTLANGIDAHTYSLPSQDSDITVYVFEPAEQLLAIVVFQTAPAENDAAVLDATDMILNSVAFHGDPVEFFVNSLATAGIVP